MAKWHGWRRIISSGNVAKKSGNNRNQQR